MQEDKSQETSSTDDENLIRPIKFNPVSGTKKQFKPRFRLRSMAVIIGLVLSAGVAWYIVTGKSVHFEAIPNTALLEISGGLKLKLADRYLLRQGNYTLRLTADGYHPLEIKQQISNDRSQQYQLKMRRLPGRLNINTNPVTSSEIWINEIFRGKTPATVSGLEFGKYTVRIDSERFFDFETEIDIEGLDKEQILTAELMPAWANISLSSFPTDADIFVDDEMIGSTPITIEMLEGEHNFRIKLAGHKLWQKTIRVLASEDQVLEDITLDPADAVVQIITIPDKANITVNGEYIGQSPVEAALTPGTQSMINAFKPGYSQASRSINLSSGEDTSIRLQLKSETASVSIFSNPSDAQVYIDGKLNGAAIQTIELTTTPHTIEIRKQGYIEYKTIITPRPNIAQQINVQLKTLEQVKLESIKPVILTSAGQSINLFEPVSVVMGASRREPGRRANETIRNIQFSRSFYLSETEVTNAEFRQFEANHNSGTVQENNLNGDKQPVVNISWEQAALYCNWLSEQDSLVPFYLVVDKKVTGFNAKADGYRLPSEAEWEWAARETGGNQLKFSWGNEMPPKQMSGNFADISAAPIIGNIIKDYNDKHMVSAPVASFTANSKGLYDLGGNVAEWTHDFYDISVSNDSSNMDPLGPESGEHHVIKGSSWAHGSITELRLSFKDYSSEKRNDIGFRIARYLQ
ncbi:MAG: sulfatase activating formylglycine-generating enzyme [Gammaproteobacteria bacterium]|jgi:formylglycine-generating enzyme required for sulfatase activity